MKKLSSAAFPWTLDLTLALLLSSVIFGFNHLYQGAGGVAGTAIVGFLFGLLFLLTGSLALPIIFHAVMGLRVLAILRPPADPLSPTTIAPLGPHQS